MRYIVVKYTNYLRKIEDMESSLDLLHTFNNIDDLFDHFEDNNETYRGNNSKLMIQKIRKNGYVSLVNPLYSTNGIFTVIIDTNRKDVCYRYVGTRRIIRDLRLKKILDE
ncbi:MAG: hypothetical protein SLAVMIC_00732 [uncultured marine phage]|uniref:Uncharacterized protein n=1 Tax=uncultured marine phage TaxID=707152 RepID=A0A8D9FRC0_9VIRU|nr:MAG: hypothetical protein SLAVMIC_00732 [uncultured marine phage]